MREVLEERGKGLLEEAGQRVREVYVPSYAKNRFPEHERQLEALKLFAESRPGHGD